MHRSTLMAAVLLLAAAMPAGLAEPARQEPAAPEQNVPFAALADDFAKALGLDGTRPDENSLSAALRAGYVFVRLGAFEVRYPAAPLVEKSRGRELQAIAKTIVDLQSLWLEKVAAREEKAAGAAAAKALSGWIRSWKLEKAAGSPDPESGERRLLALLNAGEPVEEASAAFARALERIRFREPAQDAAGPREGVLLVFAPTRKDFLGLGSFIGSLSPENQRILWHDGLAVWTAFSRDGANVLALEHAAGFPGQGDITAGLDMNAREDTGLLQHVAQAAMELLLADCYGAWLPEEIRNGIAMTAVVALFKENNVRAGGGAGGNETGAYSRFVRGGRSSGGKLPPRNAESGWRKDKGKDYFVKALREAQKAGAEEALKTIGRERDRRAFFLLRSDAGVADLLVEAPFFSANIRRDPVPEDYENDYLEFFRAYRCAFIYWMAEKAGGTKNGFSALFGPDASVPEGQARKPFEEAVLEAFGMPLSARESEPPSLEWEFLGWLD